MENTNELPIEEYRQKIEYIEFQDRRAHEWRRAADRAANRGDRATAIMFRNEAYFIEQDTAR